MPTAVTVSPFTATDAGRAINLVWRTASEIDNCGFNLYRAGSLDGPRFKLNAQLIPSQVHPGSPQGAAYSYRDLTVRRYVEYYYWLEDVAYSGGTARHGPLRGTLAQPPGVKPHLVE